MERSMPSNCAGSTQPATARQSEAVEVTMPLDPTYWSNFRAEDLEGSQLMLDAFLQEGNSRDRVLRFGEGLRFEQDELDGEGEVTATHSGSYGYRYTSRTTGELSLEFDDGEACQLRLTFSGRGSRQLQLPLRGVIQRTGKLPDERADEPGAGDHQHRSVRSRREPRRR